MHLLTHSYSTIFLIAMKNPPELHPIAASFTLTTPPKSGRIIKKNSDKSRLELNVEREKRRRLQLYAWRTELSCDIRR